MNLEFASATSLARLRATLRQVKQTTQSELASLPDDQSARYKWLKGYDRELDRLIQGRRSAGTLTVKPLAERLAGEVPIARIYDGSQREAAQDLNSPVGSARPRQISLAFPLIDKSALRALEDYNFELLKRATDDMRGGLKGALRLGVLQGDGTGKIIGDVLAKVPELGDRFLDRPGRQGDPGYVVERVVRTELHRAQFQGHYLAYGEFGVTRLEVIGRGIDCPICGQHIGVIYRYDACPQLPLHPNCRCDIVPVERGDGNWLLTQRQVDWAQALPLPDGFILSPAAAQRIAEQHPETMYAWSDVPDVLSRGSASTSRATAVSSISLSRSKPFLSGYRKFTVQARGKSIFDAWLEK